MFSRFLPPHTVIKKHIFICFFTYMFFYKFFEKNHFRRNRSKNVTTGKSKKNGSFKKKSPRNLDSRPRYGHFYVKILWMLKYMFFLRIFRKNRIFWGPLRFLYKHNHVKDRKKLTIFKKRSASKTRFLADLWPILIYSINICFFLHIPEP